MSGVPYLGSKISLISKSGIRYEGILVDVNPQESTITFEQVRFFGTEGRRPGNEIPPMDKVFECVVFRSSDIEDLQVYEEAPAAKTAPAASAIPDPAVVSSVESKDEVVKMPTRNYASALSSGQNASAAATTATAAPSSSIVNTQESGSFASAAAAKPRSYSTAAGAAAQNHRPAQQRSSKVVVPDSEFDFSSANARFSKDSIDEPVESVGPAYNKHASFFDDISCQAKEQLSGERSDRLRNERELNMETFGQAAPYRRYHHRGRGRGRGYHRGGYQHHHGNRSNNDQI